MSLPVVTSVYLNQMWHQAYRNFRETTVFMMTGLELFQKTKYGDAFLTLDKFNSAYNCFLRALSREFSVAHYVYLAARF